MKKKFKVLGGLRLRVVEGRRGDPREVVIGEGGHRYRDGRRLCSAHTTGHVTFKHRRRRRLLDPEDGEPGELVYVPDVERSQAPSGWYRDGSRLKPQPRGKVQKALCECWGSMPTWLCTTHRRGNLGGVLHPGSKGAEYSGLVGELARAYRKFRGGDPTDLSPTISVQVAVIEQQILPRVVAGEAEAREELEKHVRALAQTARAQTSREKLLEKMMHPEQAQAFAMHVLLSVKEAFAEILEDVPKTTKAGKMLHRRARAALGRLQRGLAEPWLGEEGEGP